MSKFGEDLFQSIDTIVQARLENLPYDKTIVCTIKSLDSETIGKYTVSYQNTDLIAYSEKKDYLPNEEVYVSVQQGDFSKKKIITGRVIEEKIEEVEVRPFENFISCEDISYSDQINYLSLNNEEFKLLYENNNLNYTGYDSLGVKFSISTNLKNKDYTVVDGNYYIKIIIGYIDQLSNSYLQTSINHFIKMEDMIFINAYDTKGYCNQEKVFNVENKIIKSIKIQLCQDKNFKNIDGKLLTPQEGDLFKIYVRDLKLQIGYKKPDIQNDEYKIYLYSTGLYNYSTDFERLLNTRLIYRNKEGKYIGDQDILKNNGAIYYGKLDPNSSAYSSKYNGIGYIDLENFQGEIKLSNENAKEYYKASFSPWNSNLYYSSNSIIFTNINYIANLDLEDALLGLQLITPNDSQSVFNEYGQDKQLLNNALKNKTFYLYLKSGGISGGLSLKDAKEIVIQIPASNTMILFDAWGTESKNSEIELIKYFTYTFQVETMPEDNKNITNEPNKIYYYEDQKCIKIPFKIKDLYNQNNINNTIICTCKFNNNPDQTVKKELLFGYSGSMGSDYILQLKLFLGTSKVDNEGNQYYDYKEVNCVDSSQPDNKYFVGAYLYNYTMTEDFDHEITYKWTVSEKTIEKTVPLKEKCEIEEFPDDTKKSYIKATVKMGNNNDRTEKDIMGYLPIAYSSNAKEYNYIKGCTTIVYDITGKKPYYYTDDYVLYSEKGEAKTSVVWSIFSTEDLIIMDSNKIIPPNIYQTSLEDNAYVQGTLNGTIVWRQPICVIQNKYPSAMWNGEGNKKILTGDYDIISNVVGQFDKEDNGVFIGIVKEKNTNKEKFGIFGYYKGQKKFELSNETLLIDLKITNSSHADKALQANKALQLVNNEGEALNIGTVSKPVYFENGIPKVCTSLSIKADSATNADTATTAINYKTTNGSAEIETTINNLINRISELEKKVTNLEQNNS